MPVEGRQTSEYAEARKVRNWGWVLVCLGVPVALVGGGLLDRVSLVLAGVGIGALGAAIVSISVASYARARGLAKSQPVIHANRRSV